MTLLVIIISAVALALLIIGENLEKKRASEKEFHRHMQDYIIKNAHLFIRKE